MKAVDLIERAIGTFGAQLVDPAIFAQIGQAVGNADGMLELLERAENDRAMSPRAVIPSIKVVTAGHRRIARRTIGGDAITEHARNAPEFAAGAGFFRWILGPASVDHHSHGCLSYHRMRSFS